MKTLYAILAALMLSMPLISTAQTGTITARVWNDKDGDGIQDNNESGANINGVTVQLLNSANAIVTSDVTAVNGTVTFTSVAVGNYKLKFLILADHKFTGRNKGSDEAKDSDAKGDGTTDQFSVADGQTVSNQDAGMWAPGSVVARVWNDKDGDGIQDNNESGANINGVTVQVVETDNSPLEKPNNGGPVIAVTSGNGTATLDYIPANRPVKLKFTNLPDHAITGRNKGSDEAKDSDMKGDGTTDQFSVSKGSHVITNQDAGLWAPGSAQARVWNDKDGDGIQDNNESGANINGVMVQVVETNGTPLNKPNGGGTVTATTVNGIANLDYIPANRPVKLKFTNLPDHAVTGRNKGSDEAKDSDMKSDDGTTDQFSVSKGSHVITNQDAGLWAPGTVTARVWNDKDGDGVQDNNESGANISGVKVEVIELGGSTISMGTTNGSGLVSLYMPADRPVKLKFTNKADHAITGRNKGGVESKDSDMKGDGTTDQFSANKGSHNITDQDAGLWAPGTVTARVWNDKDGDGIQDNNESGANINGVKVEVIELGGSTISMGTTSGNGTVSLYMPADRPVKLKFTNKADHAITGRNKGGVESKDSDMKGDGTTDQFSANKGSHNITDQDAGLWAPGTAKARVWIDKDGDGIQDNNESGGNNNVFGMRVNLIETNGNPVLKNGQPVFGITDCGTGEAFLDYVPANRPVKLEFVKFSGGVYTGRNKGSQESKDSDAKGDGTTDQFSADRGSDSHTAYDAGLTTRGNFSDVKVIARVWNDKDGDGKQDDSNSNLSNIKVNLLDKNNKTCFCDKTGSNGLVELPGIGGNTYKLEFDLPKDHAFTTKDKGGVNDNEDSDADRNNGRTSTFNLSSGQTVTKYDAGLWVPGTIQARVWNDKDGDGKQDDSNANVSGITVKLLETDNSVIKSVVTGSNGIATITGVPADRSVKLEFEKQTGQAFTTKDKGGVNDNEDSDADRNNGRTATFKATKGSQLFTKWDAGVWLPATIQARVWNDKDGDGKQDDSNSNVGGVTVNLLNSSNGVIATTTTQSNGIATFTDVPADVNVKLEFEKQAGHAFTTKDKGGVNDNEDSDADRNNGRTATFKSTKGSQLITKWDAGVWLPATVQARVWNDKDGDGKQDDSNSNVGGVTVNLLNSSNGVIASATTQSNGIATFNNVPADVNVKLEFVAPALSAFTTKDKGGVNDNEDSDADRNNGRTATFKSTKGSQLITKWDAGVWLAGTVQARVWNDKDGDGKQDDSNSNVGSVTVNLLNSSNGLIASTTTQSNGIATFNNVPADVNVKLEFVAPALSAFTTKDKGGVNDNEDSDADRNNGRTTTFKLTKGSQTISNFDAGVWLAGTIQARVWNDKDGDGKQDDSNANVSGVTVELLDGGNNFIASTTTASNGIATFNNVPTDQSLKLQFFAPTGFEFTTKDKGGVNDNEDSDADKNNGRTTTFSIKKGSQTITQWDAGVVAINVGSRAADLANGQGVQRATELTEMSLFPVPATSNLNVQFTHTQDELVQYMIIDLQGRVVANQPWRLIKGHNQIELNVNDLAGGTYFFVIRGEQVIERKTFSVVRR